MAALVLVTGLYLIIMNMKKLYLINVVIGILVLTLQLAWAQDEQALEPEVTIVQRGDKVIEEYRVNGNLYMIKITPSKGWPYYLVDSDGDGVLETRRNDLDPDVLIPRWTIFSW